MKYTIIILMQLVVLLVQGCTNDYTEDLSGGYFYRDEGPDTKDILGGSSGDIYSKVISYDYNDDFIIVAQRPNFKEYRESVAFDMRCDDTLTYPQNSIGEIKSENVADSILKHDQYYINIFSRFVNYWIISHKNRQMYGPYSKEEFQRKRIELSVPDNLQIHVQKE